MTLTYQYDGLNRVTQKSVPGSASGAAGYAVYYGYDVRGLQLYARFGSSSGAGVSNAYDGFGRLTTSTTTMGGASRSLSYLYDVGSRRTRITFPDGMWFGAEYDGAGRPTVLRYQDGAILRQMGYDALGRRTSLSGGNGTSTGYGYDAIGRMTGLQQTFPGAGLGQALTFGYNPASQVTSETRLNDLYAWTGHYNVARAYTTNGLNQYTAAGPATFAYDANGNLTSDGATSYVYDAENRLVSASGATSASLAYDPNGRLFETAGGSAGTTRFLYDGDALVAEYDGSNALLRRYVHGAGVDEPLLWLEGADASNVRWLHADHHGSIIAASNAADGAAIVNSYDDYGIPGTQNQGRFQYTGQIWLPELGLYHYKARLYSPTLSRGGG